MPVKLRASFKGVFVFYRGGSGWPSVTKSKNFMDFPKKDVRRDPRSHNDLKICEEMERYMSGQIIATSAEVTPNDGLGRETSPNHLNSGLGIIVICPEICGTHHG